MDVLGWEALLLLPTGRRVVTITRRTRDSLVVRAPPGTAVGERVRLGFRHEGAAPGPVRLLAEVQGQRARAGGAVELGLKCKALHSPAGRACLADFLRARFLGLPTPLAAFEAADDGAFFFFRREGAGAPDPMEDEVTRTTVRTPVRFACTYSIHDGTLSEARGRMLPGQAYNVTDHGLYIATEELTPGRGSHVFVDMAVALGPRPVRIRLGGEVYWSSGAAGGAAGGAFAVELHGDDEDGKVWRAFVEIQGRFGQRVR